MKPFENNIVFGKGGTMNPRKYYEIEARVRIWLAFNITEHKALKYKAKFSKDSNSLGHFGMFCIDRGYDTHLRKILSNFTVSLHIS